MYSSFVELFRDRAAHQGQDLAYTFLGNGETEVNSFTYGELEARARAIAVDLSQHIHANDRVLLVYKPGLEFIAAFLACQFAGAIAVPVYPPRKPEEWTRFAAIARDCSAVAVCAQSASVQSLHAGFNATPGLGEMPIVASDDIDLRLAADWRDPSLISSDVAFLQYTSGSTGDPKGVVVSHANLLHNSSLIHAAFGHSRDTVIVSWLPQYHDMGLIGAILASLYAGGRCVLMSPFAFLERPLRWLKAISDYRGTTAGAPNFAYELCVRRLTDEALSQLDLSSWNIAFNGAEPVRLETLERFAAKFAACGFRRDSFYPCYGLAEGTLISAGFPTRRAPVAIHVDADALEHHRLVEVECTAEECRSIVSCGHVLGQEARIVNPISLRPCNDGEVGEIWLKGPSVAQGYWDRQDATEETFQGYIAGTGEGPFLRTGDLGTLRGNELFVTGRLKEIIIINGRNHYPHDIERTVQSGRLELTPGGGAAFSIDVGGTERLVVVQEISTSAFASADVRGLADDIRVSIAERHGIGLYETVFIKRGTLEKTSSGKIRRRAMRKHYLSGSLNALFRSGMTGLAKAASV